MFEIKEVRTFEVTRNKTFVSVRAVYKTDERTNNFSLELLDDIEPEELEGLRHELQKRIGLDTIRFGTALQDAREKRRMHIQKLQDYWEENH